MRQVALAILDDGEANARLLAKEEHRADFRRVEAAGVKRRTHLCSPEAKRILARCFYSFQSSVYIISKIGRSKLTNRQIEAIETEIEQRLEAATVKLNRAIDMAGVLFRKHSIEVVATYDQLPLQEEISICSSLGRRYYELIVKLDQLMPLMQTLEIEEIIKLPYLERERTAYKRAVFGMTMYARKLSVGVLRRMHQMDAAQTLTANHRDAGQPQPSNTMDPVPPMASPLPAPPIVASGSMMDSSADAEATNVQEALPQAAE